jgi:hypothetical protein
MTALEPVALLIACLGLFGIAAFSSERRTQEIAIEILPKCQHIEMRNVAFHGADSKPRFPDVDL